MEVLGVIIPIGVVLTLVIFFIFEQRALRAHREKGAPTYDMRDITKKFKEYDTIQNVTFFGIGSFIITLIIAIAFYTPVYGLVHALLYIFLTTFIGTIIIFGIKWKKSLIIKVFAAFLYGVVHMGTAAAAFLTSYIVS
jgi:hypothetical protein